MPFLAEKVGQGQAVITMKMRSPHSMSDDKPRHVCHPFLMLDEQQLTPVFKFLHNILSFSAQQNASGGRIMPLLRLNG